MADTSLDDFFAKKDKSKKKAKSKTAGAGDVEESTKPTKKEKKRRDKENAALSIGSLQKEDEEWVDFEEEKAVDYSGLRIQTLQIANKEEQDRENEDDDGDDEDGENRDRRDGASGPWNKNVTPAAPAPAPVEPEPEKKEEVVAPKAPSKYIPPAQRHAMANSSSGYTPSSTTSKKKKEAPNVNSEFDFPTLGGGGKPSAYSSSSSADIMDNPNHRRGVNLTLENKFSALQD